MTICKYETVSDRVRPRSVASILCPTLHVDGNSANNFEADTLTMLESPTTILSERHRRFLSHCIARRVKANPTAAPDGREVLLTDAQWRSWRDIRTLFDAARRFHARSPLTIPMRSA